MRDFQSGLGKLKGARIILLVFRSARETASTGSPVLEYRSLEAVPTHDAHSASVLTFIAGEDVDGKMVISLRV